MSIHFRTRTVSYNLPLNSMFGACCTDNSCAETTAASCYENPNGRFFHNQKCEDINCEFGVCCNNGLCSLTTEEGCIAINGTFVGKQYDCLTYNCSGVGSELDQACCFSDNVCEDLKPSVCLSRGGVPRGPNSSCAVINAAGGCGVTGATAHGVCCIGGQCLSPQGFDPNGVYHEFGYTAGDCAALGGLYGGSGSTCGAGTSFGTSYPCVFPTGACCFGNSPAGGITYCDNGKTYGDCLNPPTLGGSGGAGWFEGKTCGVLQDTNICTSGDFLNDVACCIPNYRQNTHDETNPQIDSVILENYTCINTSTVACNSIGGFVNPDGKLCDEVSCCSESYQPPCQDDVLGTFVEYLTLADDNTFVNCVDTSLIGSLDLRDTYVSSNAICPTCPVRAYTTLFSDTRPTICDADGEQPYVAFVCVWKFSNARQRYEYHSCDEKQYFESVTPFSSLSAPLSPEKYTSGDYIYTKVNLGISTELGSPLNCERCNFVSDVNWIGACCNGSECNTVLGADNCNNDFYLAKQCTLNGDSLPCVDNTSLYYKNCFDKSTIPNINPTTLEQISGCQDKFDLVGAEPTQQNMLNLAIATGLGVTDITQYPDTDGTDCESCNAPCSRNRGTCCLGGRPIYNVTLDECNAYGGSFNGCEGRPYDKPSSGGFNYKPTNPCTNSDGFSPNVSGFGPEIKRGVAVASQSNLEYFRRGPFNTTEQIINSASNTLPIENDRPMGVGAGSNAQNFPNKPLVQIFWNAPSETTAAQRNYAGNYDKDNVCENANLPLCNYYKDVLGSCCVRIKCKDGYYSDLNDEDQTCFTCVDGISDCECAVLNGSTKCGDYKWTTEGVCDDCVCTDIDNFRYQVDDGCIKASTEIKSRRDSLGEEGQDGN